MSAMRSEKHETTPTLKLLPPRKVCLMVEPSPFSYVSGYANRFNEMLRFLALANDSVEIITTDAEKPDDNYDDAPQEQFGFPVYWTWGFTLPMYKHLAVSFDIPMFIGWKVLREQKPDLIHVSSPGFLVFAAIIYSRLLCKPLVMSYHTHLPIYVQQYLHFIPWIEVLAWFIIRAVHSFADLTLVTSPQIQQEFVDHRIPRVDLWRKGIDADRFHPRFYSKEMRGKMTQGNPDDHLILHVGRVATEKRLKQLKDVLELCPTNTRLCLVGAGPQESELREYFADTKTHFTGQLRGDELSMAYASSDVFCMPSDSETLGFAVLESMASGVPVVAARAGGIPDMIQDEITSFLVPPRDAGEMARCVNFLLNDPATRVEMGQKARKEIEQWGWEAATSVLRNIQYEKAIRNFNHGRGRSLVTDEKKEN